MEFAFSVKVDHRAEWEQIFEEAWRVMKYRFYDPDMHGRDWDAIKAHYKPLLAHVGSYERPHDLANQMIGELNASHVGVSGPSSVAMDREYPTRLPGIELEPAQGRYRVSHVYRDGPADKEWLDLEVGDFVLAIDGQEIRRRRQLLEDPEPCPERVRDPPGGRLPRRGQRPGSADPDRDVSPELSSTRSGWRGTGSMWSGSRAGRSPTSTSGP